MGSLLVRLRITLDPVGDSFGVIVTSPHGGGPLPELGRPRRYFQFFPLAALRNEWDRSEVAPQISSMIGSSMIRPLKIKDTYILRPQFPIQHKGLASSRFALSQFVGAANRATIGEQGFQLDVFSACFDGPKTLASSVEDRGTRPKSRKYPLQSGAPAG